MEVVIIGLGAAGFAAALAVKKTSRDVKITFIDEKDYDLLHPCGLPFALEGKIRLDSLKHQINAEAMRIDILHKSKVEKIDIKNKKLIFRNKKNEIEEIKYDKLLIATGSSPFIPDIEGKEFAITVKNTDDIGYILKKIKTEKTATIVGAGAIGLECAYALAKQGIKVKIIEMLPHCLSKAIDEDISRILEGYLERNNIDLEFNKKLEKIKKDELVILATGVRPNLDFLKDSGIKTGKFGIIVNAYLETNIKDIYAAGDCIETKNIVSKKPFGAWIATTAYQQGTIAGFNIAGGKQEYKGTLAPLVSVIGDIEVGAVGLNSNLAKENDFEIIEGKAKSKTKPDWMQGSQDITVKIIADKKTGKIIGGQALGKNVKEKIDVISTAIQAGFTLQELSETELAYCPAVSQTYDVLTMAVDIAIRKI